MCFHQAFPKSHRKIRVIRQALNSVIFPFFFLSQHEIYIIHIHTHTHRTSRSPSPIIQPTFEATHVWLICTVPLFLIQINKSNNYKKKKTLYTVNICQQCLQQ